MLPTKRHSTSILTIKEILENGFVAGASSHTHSSPDCSYCMDSSSASKPDTRELLVDSDNAPRGSSLCAARQPESLQGCGKMDPHSPAQGTSDLSLLCFCKTHRGQAALDLSGLPCEQPGRAGSGSLLVVTPHNTSTPCKRAKRPKSLLSKSTELVGDTSTLGKMPAPRWEISAIQVPQETSLPLDASTEELSLLGCSKSDIPSLETSVAVPPAWPDASKRSPALPHSSAASETQRSAPDPVPPLPHQAP